MIKNTKTDRTVESLQILQINTTDKYGGAAGIAWNLFKAYKELGHQSHLAVGYKRSIDSEVIQIIRISDLTRGQTSGLTPARHQNNSPEPQALQVI